MDKRRIRQVATAVLAKAVEDLVDSHGVPLLVFGVGQDHAAGRLGVLPAPYCPGAKALAMMLRWAADQFDAQAAGTPAPPDLVLFPPIAAAEIDAATRAKLETGG
jgi:hypothetical protein